MKSNLTCDDYQLVDVVFDGTASSSRDFRNRITAYRWDLDTAVDSNGNGAGGDRPNYDPAGRLVPDPVTGNLRTFTTAGMFVAPTGPNGVPQANSLGNGSLERNTLRAPAVFNWDLSVAKRFRLRGAHALTIRADVLNAFNQDNYGIPINAMNNLSFGQNANNWGNRSVTLSAKYAF